MFVFGVLFSLAVAGAQSECTDEPVLREDAISSVTSLSYLTKFRGRKTITDYSKIVVEYKPFSMVTNPECVDEQQLIIQVRTADSNDWITFDGRPEGIGAGIFRWTISDIAPCKDHYFQFSIGGPVGQVMFTYPDPVPAAPEEEIIQHFSPKAPGNLRVSDTRDSSASLSWEAAECATKYEIGYSKKLAPNERQFETVPAADGNSFVISEGLEPCTEYEISMSSVLGDDVYSDDEATVNFATPPAASSADKLDPQVTPDTNSMLTRWSGFDKLSCVTKYSVSVCKEQEEQCEDAKEVVRNDALEYLEYNAENLAQCSSYTLEIKPLYDNVDLAPKVVEFRTKSPKAEGVAEGLLPVSAQTGNGQEIVVNWSAVDCAQSYEVYQKVNSVGGDWELVESTKETTITLNGVPCTEYMYGVLVIIDDVKSKIMMADDSITTNMDDSSFVPPNIELNPLEDGVELSWDHGACINGYVIKTCRHENDTICEVNSIDGNPSNHNITYTVENLEPCTSYNVEILPTIEGSTFDTESYFFETASPQPSPPNNFNAELESGRVSLEWDQVVCASGYIIVQHIGEEETTWEIDDPSQLSEELNTPEPCVTYRYGVKAVVGGGSSSSSDLQEIVVPPKAGQDHLPELQLLENVNDTIRLSIKPARTNIRCQVDSYEVKYGSLDQGEVSKQFHADDLSDTGDIVLTFSGASKPGLSLEGRINYQGFEDPSPWIQAKSTVIIKGQGSSDILVPIIVGLLVAVVVILIVIFFVVKRRRNQTKYDVEKDNTNKGETQKLNEEHPEAEA